MKRTSTIATVLGAAAVSLFAAASALADTVQMHFVETGQGRSVRINMNGNKKNVFAGQLIHSMTGGVGVGAMLNGLYVTFCTDIMEYVTPTAKTYDVVDVEDVPAPAMGLDKAAAILDMYNYANGQQLDDSVSNDFAAAFQIAVWEIVNDFTLVGGRSSLSVSDGSFKTTKTDGSTLSLSIRNYLDDLFDAVGLFGGVDRAGYDVLGLRSMAQGNKPGSQDQLVEIPMVPLPSAAGLAAAGLLGLSSRRRRSLA